MAAVIEKSGVTGLSWDVGRARDIVSGLAGLDGALLPILHALQAEFGFVPKGCEALIADELNLSRAEVLGVISFYHDFRRAPPGRHILKICRAEACQAMGAEARAEEARAQAGVGWHETTRDGALTLEPAFCLGLCACGPAAMLDGEPIARLDAGRLRAVVQGCLTEAAR